VNAEEKDQTTNEDKGSADEGDKNPLGHDIPPASFYSIVTTFQIPALQFLGELRDPSSGKVEVLPPLAKFYIDCLAVLDAKTRGNLSEEEKKVLDNVLTQLRLIYVKNASETTAEGK
jgi:hypothetical protein